MKAIIIASGRGERLGALTDERPPCMLEVAGRPVLHHQIEALRFWGIDDVVVIRGHCREAVEGPDVRYVDDVAFAEHGALGSLFAARRELVGDVIVSDGEVLYHPDAVATLLRSPALGTLLVDRRWRRSAENDGGATELCRSTRDGVVVEVGRNLRPIGTLSAFVGLARFRPAMTARLYAGYERASARGDDLPFGHARSLRAAGLMDLFHDLIDRGDVLSSVPIDAGWRGLGTARDVESAHLVLQ
jgi:choline kinase